MMKRKQYSNILEKDFKKIAESLANDLKNKDIILLKGDLGAGKTTFTKYLVHSLASDYNEVTSPTFSLVNLYNIPNKFDIWHFDLYRIQNIDEVYELGIEDAFDYGISIIEWPEIIENILPEKYIEVKFYFSKDSNMRNLEINFRNK